MKIRSLVFCAAALALPFTAVACSDEDSTNDFSESEIVDKLVKEAGMPKEAAECVAPELKKLDIDLDATYSELMDSEDGKKFQEAVTKCVTSTMDTATPGAGG